MSDYLLMWNEPYSVHAEGPKKEKYLSPKEGAEIMGRVIQKVADTYDMKLVSPVTGDSDKKLGWMAEFLKACWEKRNLAENACDVSKIKAFAVHNFKCKEKKFRKEFKGKKSLFSKGLVKLLTADGDNGPNWKKYVTSMPIWITASNCNWDKKTPDAEETCMRITGQR